MATDDELQKSLRAAETPAGRAKLTPRRAATPETPAPPPAAAGVPGNLAARLSPTAHRQALKAASIEDTIPYDVALRFSFLGLGQGGSRIAASFWSLGYRRVGIFNTTDADFTGLDSEIPRLSLDIGGAAKDMRLARQALSGREEELRDLMTRAWGAKMDGVLICVSLGGGSGSGTALPLVHLARKYLEDHGQPQRVGAIISLPSADEGQLVARNACTAFKELYDANVSPIVIIDNDRVHTLYQPSMKELLPKSNELVSNLFHLFNQLAAVKSPFLTFDPSELAQLLDGGIVVMGSADLPLDEIKSPADVSAKIRDELAHSILADVDLRTGRKAACLFVGDDEVLSRYTKDYFAAGFSMLDRIVGASHSDRETNPTVIHRGLYPGQEPGLQCYTLISELSPPTARLQALAKVAGFPPGTLSSVAKHLNVG